MEDLGNQGENLPVVGGALDANVAPNSNPPTPQIPHQEGGGASTSTSLTMTEFASFMESFISSMEILMKVLVRDEVDKKLASFSQTPSTSSTFCPNTTLDVDGVKETPKLPPHSFAPSYNDAAPSYARPHIPMPHINHTGDPPLLNPDSFGKWKLAMESHVRSASTQLWWIILRGHHPEDPSSLSPREEVDEQLNDTACPTLRQAVPDDYQDSIALLKMAKEIWDTLREIFEGDISVQRSCLALLKTEVNMFVRKDGETADQVFRRLKSLVLDLRNYGGT